MQREDEREARVVGGGGGDVLTCLRRMLHCRGCETPTPACRHEEVSGVCLASHRVNIGKGRNHRPALPSEPIGSPP